MILQTLAFLKEYKIVFFVPRHVISEDFDEEEIAAKLGVFKVVALPSPNATDSFFNFFFRRLSFQESMFYKKSSESIIQSEIKIFNPSVAIFDMLRMGTYAESFSQVVKVLEIDDMLSLRYRRMLSHSYPGFDLLGTYSKYYPKVMSKIVNKFLVKPLLWIESKKIFSSELKAAKRFHFVNFVSADEADTYRDLIEGVEVFSIPPTVSVKKINRNIGESASGVKVFGFIGNLRTNQNLLSFNLIVNDVLPNLEGDYRFVVIGGYDDRAVELSSENNRVVLKGFVDEFDDEMMDIQLLLAPIAFGTGIKLKILDAMSYGVPVLTNSIGIEGILGEPGKHYFVEDNYLDVAKKANELFRSPGLMEKVGRAGQELVKEFYSPELNEKKYIDYLGRNHGA